jgi:hypothetical protein
LKTESQFRRWGIFIFSLAILLRLSLVLLNREANDPHEGVANLIIQTGRLPQKDDCWECFQPKLYHLAFAMLLKTLKMEYLPAYQQNVPGQALNFGVAIITLAVVYIFIRGLPEFDAKLKLFSFALVSLNPNLIGINSQATNDTFVILFSTLSIFLAYRFLKYEKTRDLVLCFAFLILGISTKTNALVTFIAIVGALTVWTFVAEKGKRSRNLLITAVFSISVGIISLVNPLDQYIPNIQKNGSPILININKDPIPHFSGKYSADASGIWYIGDGFFTFKFLDLLKHPRLDPKTTAYLPHQTSFWTILYGRAHSIHFDNAPPSWSTEGTSLFPLLRILYILAIIPALLLLLGWIQDIYLFLKSLLEKDLTKIQVVSYGLFVFVLIGFLLFQITYSLQYRSLSVIKAIFVFPALLSFPVFFLRASKTIIASFSKKIPWFEQLFDISIVSLLVCYILDVTVLIKDLTLIFIQHHLL